MSISKICMHWTAGSNNPCQTDIDAYHFIFDSAGKEFKGKFAPKTILIVMTGNMQNTVAEVIQGALDCLAVEWQDLT